jgi:hypothetical protein
MSSTVDGDIPPLPDAPASSSFVFVYILVSISTNAII